jgi:hypothetical protein
LGIMGGKRAEVVSSYSGTKWQLSSTFAFGMGGDRLPE